ncbi:MAG: hypothetical protein AAB966_00315 [Patescibacteria group bacterium]
MSTRTAILVPLGFAENDVTKPDGTRLIKGSVRFGDEKLHSGIHILVPIQNCNPQIYGKIVVSACELMIGRGNTNFRFGGKNNRYVTYTGDKAGFAPFVDAVMHLANLQW